MSKIFKEAWKDTAARINNQQDAESEPYDNLVEEQEDRSMESAAIEREHEEDQKGSKKSVKKSVTEDVLKDTAKKLKEKKVSRWEARMALCDLGGMKLFSFELDTILDDVYGKPPAPEVLDLDEDAMLGIFKTNILKPGQSIHTDKWDKCVAEVKASSPDADSFAVCTSQLGEESFKSQFRHMSYTKGLVKKAKQKVSKDFGVGNAGPVPNSLLSGQDLEGEISEDQEEANQSEIDLIEGNNHENEGQ